MTKEQQWLKERCGYLSASMIKDIVAKSGKITLGVQSAIRSKRFEREHGYSLPVSSRPMEIGKANEPYAVAWFRESRPDIPIIYSQDLPKIPFWTVDWAKFGASPDAFSEDESIVVEFKTLVSNTNIEFYSDERTPYEAKMMDAWNEHGDQILAQFLSNPKVQTIYLVKHVPQDDDNEWDFDSPTAPWRGHVFEFKRESYTASLASLKERICLVDALIDSDLNPSEMDGYQLVNGILKRVEK